MEGDDIYNITADITGSLNGGDNNDTFNINATDINITIINGDAGIDKVVAANEINYWNITGIDSGSIYTNEFLTTQRSTFTSIENITGGSADDTFIITTAGSISNGIDGGSELNLDTVDLSSMTSVTINLTDLAAGNTIYSNIEEFVGNNIDSTMEGENLDAIWDITGTNSGNVYREDGTGKIIYFRDFNNLTGGSGDDLFDFTSTGSINGIISGGVQDFSNIYGDIVDLSEVNSPVNVTLETTDDVTKTNIVGVERIIGNNIDSTITGQDLDTTWLITDNNDGEISNSTTGNSDGNVDFINFTNLTGNNQKMILFLKMLTHLFQV